MDRIYVGVAVELASCVSRIGIDRAFERFGTGFNDLLHGNSRERDTLFRIILAVSLTSGNDRWITIILMRSRGATRRKLSRDRTLRWTLAILVRSALRGNAAAIPEGSLHGAILFPSKLFSTFIKRISINLYASDVANLPIVFFFFF